MEQPVKYRSVKTFPFRRSDPARRIFLSLLFSVLISFTALSQDQEIRSFNSLAEKIYLQLDSRVYTTGQTIWFKAIVTDAVDHIPTTLSGVLYAELIGPDEQVVEQKLIKISRGAGVGFFDLHENYAAGAYLVRAYTRWNKNFGTDYIFREYIKVFPSSGEFAALPVDRVTLLEKTMETENGSRFSRTVAVNERIDLQFFPESGEIVHGLSGRIGFKALDIGGNGVSVEGKIKDKDGNIVTSFKSNTLGMGSFFLKADSSAGYYAEIASPSGQGVFLNYPLPAVATRGNVLTVMQAGDEIRLGAASNYLETDSIYIEVTRRGMAYYFIRGRLKGGSLVASLPSKGLPEGIIAFTMMDSDRQPVAERLYFNERPETRLKIELSADKDLYHPREKTAFDIRVTAGNGQAAKANLSLLVINKKQMGQVQSLRKNILSWFLMGSELRGEIEDPGYYFRKENKNRLKDLDALLLTQGWRKYHYRKPFRNDTLLFRPESGLTVSGTVGAILSRKKKKEGIGLTMMTFGDPTTVQAQTTDSLGRFSFNLNEAYSQQLNILLQSADKSGKNKNYTIMLDEKQPPSIHYDRRKSIEKADSVVHFIVEKQRERKSADEAYLLASGTTVLEEVVVEDSRLTPERKKVIETYGEPDVVIDGNAIREKEEKWSYGLYSVLLFDFPEDIRIRRTGGPGGHLQADIIGGETTLVVIDGIPVSGYNYGLIPNIPPSEVRSVELIKFAKNFSRLYMDVFPEANPMSIPVSGSVIAIYTYGNKGIFGVDQPVGILKASIPVFAPFREFYSPSYRDPSEEELARPDLRALIHWRPQFETDSSGHSSVSFYNADITGEMMVVVEAISENGQIGYSEEVYEVKNTVP